MSFRRRVARALARALIYPFVTQLTMAVLVARAQFPGDRRRNIPITFGGGNSVLVVATHPDDETIGCAGAILGHLRAGDSVVVLVVTDGSGSRAGGLSPAAMAQMRRREVNDVEQMLPGSHFRLLNLPEHRWDAEELIAVLGGELATSCDIVYVPSCIDFHPEHLKVAHCIAEALQRCPVPALIVRVYEMQVPLGRELINRHLPLGDLLEAKALAIAAYGSQRGALDLWRRESWYVGALCGVKGGAEGYWQVTPDAYCRVMDAGGWNWRTTPFTSLRGRPTGDLSAHLKGIRTRLALREVAEGHRAQSRNSSRIFNDV